MRIKSTFAVIAAAAVMMFAAPQGASALPQVNGAKELNTSTVEKTHYRGHRRGWRRGYYRRNYGYGGRRHYRRGSGIFFRF